MDIVDILKSNTVVKRDLYKAADMIANYRTHISALQEECSKLRYLVGNNNDKVC